MEHLAAVTHASLPFVLPDSAPRLRRRPHGPGENKIAPVILPKYQAVLGSAQPRVLCLPTWTETRPGDLCSAEEQVHLIGGFALLVLLARPPCREPRGCFCRQPLPCPSRATRDSSCSLELCGASFLTSSHGKHRLFG